MPSLRPRTSWLPAADLSQWPACICAFFSGSRRAMAMISDSASSTTLRVLENGALNTATPRLLAAARSIWLTPMQKAPTATRSGRRGQDPLGDLRPGPDAEQAHVANAPR